MAFSFACSHMTWLIVFWLFTFLLPSKLPIKNLFWWFSLTSTLPYIIWREEVKCISRYFIYYFFTEINAENCITQIVSYWFLFRSSHLFILIICKPLHLTKSVFSLHSFPCLFNSYFQCVGNNMTKSNHIIVSKLVFCQGTSPLTLCGPNGIRAASHVNKMEFKYNAVSFDRKETLFQ